MKLEIEIPSILYQEARDNRGYISVGKMEIAWKAIADGKPLEQEPCEDVISRKSIKQKLQEHHDFFVNAYGGFSNLPQNDKSRVDEITNCIAMVVNEPSVTPQEPRKGHWIEHPHEAGPCWEYSRYECSECHEWEEDDSDYCPNCGAKMVEPQESEEEK